MSDLTTHQQSAHEMLSAIDTFMDGKPLTDEQRELQSVVARAGCYASAAYDAHVPKSGGEHHAMTRAFLLALIDPISPDLDYLRADPLAGIKAREQRQKKSH
jgi:hypothetical protein